MASKVDLELFRKQVAKSIDKEILADISAIPRFADADEVVPTPAVTLNVALGIGGFPKGRIVTITGEYSTGKTTLILQSIGLEMAKDPTAVCLFVDSENAIDLDYAEALGVDMDRFVLSQTNNLQQAADLIYQAAEAGIQLLVLDSVAGLSLESDLEKTGGDRSAADAQMGAGAKAIGTFLGRTSRLIAKNKSILFLTSHKYQSLQPGAGAVIKGGKGVRYYSSIILELFRNGEGEVDKDTGEVLSVDAKAKVTKNKVAPPFRTAEYRVKFGSGIDFEDSLVNAAITRGVEVIQAKSAGWYLFTDSKGEEKKFHGKGKLTAALRKFPEAREEVLRAVLAKIEKNQEEKVDDAEATDTTAS